jgi:hypothetical protein
MGRRGIVTLGVGLAAALAAYASVATGVLGSGADHVAGAARSLVDTPPAAASELPAFRGCEQLRSWYVRTALPQVGPWGLDGPPVLYGGPITDTAPMTRTPGSTEGAVGSSGTGTNVQTADVDESDVAKTDGHLLVRVSGRMLVVTDVSGDRPVELSRTALPGAATVTNELLLRTGHVLVVGSELPRILMRPLEVPRSAPGRPLPPGPMPPVGRRQPTRTRLVSYDLSDPRAPRLVDARSIDGRAVSTREYADGTVRVVLTTGFPRLDFVQPGRGRSLAEATRENRRVVRSAPVEAWLPTLRVGVGGSAQRPLLRCSDVRHPVRLSGPGTVSVVSFPFDAPDHDTATAVTTSGDVVYSSTDRLVVATSDAGTTELHDFALQGPRTTYVGSGSVPGIVRDRWSLDWYDGRLRVATTTGSLSRPRNAVTVLEERGGRLATTGRVDGLGRDQQLQAVRWFGDVAVVVTFRQTDPLYTLDLSDPARPRVVGTLHAPGFSSYLHPVGGHLLVALGHDVSAAGADRGTRAASFDLADPGHVRRVGTVPLGDQTVLGADGDARAFTYLPGLRTLLTPVSSWATSRCRFVALHVAVDGRLSETGSWASRPGAGTEVRALPLGGDRVALVDDSVRVVRVG